MRTCLGASAHLQSAEQLPQDWCNGTLLLHCEGYCLYRPQVAREAMARAKAAGALVSIDLASFECVQNCSRCAGVGGQDSLASADVTAVVWTALTSAAGILPSQRNGATASTTAHIGSGMQCLC